MDSIAWCSNITKSIITTANGTVGVSPRFYYFDGVNFTASVLTSSIVPHNYTAFYIPSKGHAIVGYNGADFSPSGINMTASIVDVSTDTIVTHIPVHRLQYGAAINQCSNRIWIQDSLYEKMYEINLTDYSVISVVSSSHLAPAHSRYTNLVYVPSASINSDIHTFKDT
jgi:hypothetical protein